MTRYLITLTPVGMFFFGGEETFGDGTNDNYFARSNSFPQQTTLLGMLRKEVLVREKVFKEKINDYTPDDKKRMAALIGDRSFQLEGGDQDFGKIKGDLTTITLKSPM